MAETDHLGSLRKLGPEIEPIRNEYFLETGQLRVIFGSRGSWGKVTLTEDELASVANALHDKRNDLLINVITKAQKQLADTRTYVNSSDFKAPKRSFTA